MSLLPSLSPLEDASPRFGARQARGHSLGLLLCPFQVPTELADGFGLKELPYSWYARRFTPLEVWFLRFSYENSAGYSFCLGLVPLGFAHFTQPEVASGMPMIS